MHKLTPAQVLEQVRTQHPSPDGSREYPKYYTGS
jgi:hypothetical protein